jgi:acyl-ACP thioesterase
MPKIVSESSFTELIEPPEHGRVYALDMRPGLGDCAPSGRLRLDALARWLQDVAYFDVEDAGLAAHAAWVVRRTRIHVKRFPRFGEHHRVSTFCSGLGRMWAERRTSIAAAESEQSDVEAVALWVHLDPQTKRPVPLTEDEAAVYGTAANGRRVGARLRHGTPPALEPISRWTFRHTDCDVAAHVNNAAYWQPLEEELLRSKDPERLDVELEFRTPAQPGEKLIVRDGNRRWIVSPDGETHATIVVAA